MYALDRHQYNRVRPLFAGLRYNLVVDSILDGHTPGWVYADDPIAPRIAWLWNRMDAMLVAGDPTANGALAELTALIRDLAVPDARRRGVPELSLFYDGHAWEARARALVQPWQPERTWRRFYTFGRLRVDWPGGMPAGGEVRAIDHALLAEARLENLASVQGWVLSFWPSYDAFVETGFGSALVVGGTIASWCLTVYASGSRRELGLATAPAHRRLGYATLVAAAAVDHAVARGVTPEWHCGDDNIPSIRVAEKVGFTNPERYAVWRFEI
ncbi:MAG TPA: GNAT family N-acetyltransferase [Anaerolineae bacterium]|nr:GNAT family N-acetyltransferase [Anaerolineae bacterium]